MGKKTSEMANRNGRLRARRELCQTVFDRMLEAFGPQLWWPGETAEEVIVGAVLVQNTAWKNVIKAIDNLRDAGFFSARAQALRDSSVLLPSANFGALAALPHEARAALIKPAGYFNLKSKRLKATLEYFIERCDGDLGALADIPTETLREELLATYGIGRETADSILLYALGRPIFVVDAYTLRIGARHGWFPAGTKYEDARDFFERSLPRDTGLFNEFHALLVRVGATHCRPKPVCEGCPLNARGCGRVTLQ